MSDASQLDMSAHKTRSETLCVSPLSPTQSVATPALIFSRLLYGRDANDYGHVSFSLAYGAKACAQLCLTTMAHFPSCTTVKPKASSERFSFTNSGIIMCMDFAVQSQVTTVRGYCARKLTLSIMQSVVGILKNG